jgi:hypothetical protein
MDNKFITISGKTFYLDINKVIEWCLSSSTNPLKETEINEGYDTNDEGDLTMVTKVVRESKTNNTQEENIKYDFIKLCLAPFMGDICAYEKIEEKFSYALLFNSLIKMGFLVEII